MAGLLISLPNGYRWAYGADAVLFSFLLYSAVNLPPILPTGSGARTGGLRSVFDGLRFIEPLFNLNSRRSAIQRTFGARRGRGKCRGARRRCFLCALPWIDAGPGHWRGSFRPRPMPL
ncbi:hypothetical protein ABIE67_000239 [Streptomyces sp. V4I8]